MGGGGTTNVEIERGSMRKRMRNDLETKRRWSTDNED